MRKRGEKGIWQRRYYDHVIRNEEDLWKHIDYIHFNSLKHYNIAPKDWEFSSFNKFVKNNFYDLNWCNYDDKNKISEMNLEYLRYLNDYNNLENELLTLLIFLIESTF